MSTESFGEKTRRFIKEYKPKRGCCRKTEQMISDALSDSNGFDGAVSVAEKFICPDCRAAYLRVIFCNFGTVTDPAKSFHLEMLFPDEKLRDLVYEILLSYGLVFKKRLYKNRFSLYLKDSGEIEDFFATLDTPSVSFEFINAKMMKEVSREVNRKTNFETANMQKTVAANAQYLKAIAFINDNGLLMRLPEELRETAALRFAYDTVSLAELASLHKVPISKSGVKHRLDKILYFAKCNGEQDKKD